jgi:hypothetical protein
VESTHGAYIRPGPARPAETGRAGPGCAGACTGRWGCLVDWTGAGAGAGRVAGRTVVVAGAMTVFVGVIVTVAVAAAAVASVEDLVLVDGGLRANLGATKRRSSQRGRVNTCSQSVIIDTFPTMSFLSS